MTSREKRKTPIIIGVGDYINRSREVKDAVEPMELMLHAIHAAITDAGLSAPLLQKLQSSIDSLDIVRCWTWPYGALPDLLAQKLGVASTIRHKHYPPTHSGNQPAVLLDDAARRISFGQSRVAVVAGGEALASLAACARAQKLPPAGWTEPDQQVESVFSPTTRAIASGTGAIHSIGAPIHVYPLYENAFRAHRGQSVDQNDEESAALYADFAKVAASNPYAWNYGKPPQTKKAIKTVEKRNRMICFPYPLLMNAFNEVNVAASCLLTSTEFAREVGIPEARWIYPLGGAGTRDSYNFWERPNFFTSPSVAASIDEALKVSGVSKDEIGFFDFYSCFPIVPKLCCHHLGIPMRNRPERPITLLGGLTSFGGAGNNYSMHALTEAVRLLRSGNCGKHGLIHANGGMFTYQHVVVLSSHARRDGSAYPDANPLPDLLTQEQVPRTDAEAEGEAVVETYTVEYDRDGAPRLGFIVGRLSQNGHRFVANHGDEATLGQLCSRTVEPIGRRGHVRNERGGEGRNLFFFAAPAKL